MAGSVGFAGSAVFTRRLTRSETITCILFWLTSMQLVMGLIASLHDGDMAVPSLATLPWVVLIGVAGLTAAAAFGAELQIVADHPVDHVTTRSEHDDRRGFFHALTQLARDGQSVDTG